MTDKESTYLILKFGSAYTAYQYWLGDVETQCEFILTPEENQEVHKIFNSMRMSDRLAIVDFETR